MPRKFGRISASFIQENGHYFLGDQIQQQKWVTTESWSTDKLLRPDSKRKNWICGKWMNFPSETGWYQFNAG